MQFARLKKWNRLSLLCNLSYRVPSYTRASQIRNDNFIMSYHHTIE
ncbi:hypothetical protein OROMI_033602 [Orobanche minor]